MRKNVGAVGAVVGVCMFVSECVWLMREGEVVWRGNCDGVSVCMGAVRGGIWVWWIRWTGKMDEGVEWMKWWYVCGCGGWVGDWR